MKIDGVRICHLGDLGHKPTDQMVAEIGDTDILMIPVGGKDTISAKKAMEVIEKIDPHMVIPMHYKIEGEKQDLEPLNDFIKETGAKNEPVESLKFKDFSEYKNSENTNFVILQAIMG